MRLFLFLKGEKNMTVSRMVTTDEFKKMISYNVYAENQKQQQSMKLKLLKSVEEAYGERYWRLKEGTRKAIDMLCWFASERGFVFAKDEYLADRYDISAKTIRNVMKILREAGVILTVYRRSSTQNCRTAPVHLFAAHPYYRHWENLLDLRDFQNDFQNENAEIPCESKGEEVKKVSTSYSPLNKSFKTLRKQKTVLDSTFTPSYVPEAFRNAVGLFFGEAKEIDRLWKKTRLAHRQSRMDASLEELMPTIIQSFKETIYAHKHNRIKGSFDGYFFGTLRNQFTNCQEQNIDILLQEAVGQETVSVFVAGKKPVRTEKLPEWFLQQKLGLEKPEPVTDHDEEFLAKKAEMEESLRKKREKKTDFF
jgi:DNA-binding Lrp family transcriptional regulator